MPVEILLFVFFISLFLGSFYNVVALRTLSKEKLAMPPSHCTSCNHRLSPLDLVPVFSWLFLKGKCRYCKTKISGIYPFGELLTASAYTIIIWKYGFTFEGFAQIAFITMLIIATVTDLKETWVPDRFFIIGIMLVIIIRIAGGIPVLSNILGGLGAFAMMFAIYIFSGERLGGADVKLYALIGLALGFVPSVASLFYACIVALSINIPALIMKKKSKVQEIPFVPYMTIGVLLVYILGVITLPY